ncbi:MAG TPA: LUD domain-containing protein [Chitinophagaceae bacterium]|nr:LUD domain-containing protein [Chitinophagaceae bacterium]
MKVSPAKENILRRVRHALSQPVQLPFPQAEGNQPLFQPQDQSLDICFAQQFTKLLGKFIFCATDAELGENLRGLCQARSWNQVACPELELMHVLQSYELPFLSDPASINTCDAAITTCECLIARTGSVVVSSSLPSGRTGSIFPPVHIVVAYLNQLVWDIRDGLRLVREKYSGSLPSMISLQTGPSRTADIEKTLVVGVHGPAEVYVMLMDHQQL